MAKAWAWLGEESWAQATGNATVAAEDYDKVQTSLHEQACTDAFV